MVWEGDDVKKADLGVLDISWAIIQRVDHMSEPSEYVRVAVLFSFVAMFLPLAFRGYFATDGIEPTEGGINQEQLKNILMVTVGSNWRSADFLIFIFYV